jgi:hypothetical protein
MEVINVPASQVLPVSGYVAPPSIAQVKKEAEEFFFSKGLLAHKIYKNAYTSSLADSPSSEQFIQDFFNVLENSIKTQIKNNNQDVSISIKLVFDTLRNSFNILSALGVKIDPITFFATLVAFILSKLR